MLFRRETAKARAEEDRFVRELENVQKHQRVKVGSQTSLLEKRTGKTAIPKVSLSFEILTLF